MVVSFTGCTDKNAHVKMPDADKKENGTWDTWFLWLVYYMHCYKTLFELLRMEKISVIKGTFFLPPTHFFVILPWRKILLVPGARPFTPLCLVLLCGSDFSGMGECYRSRSRDRKIFPAWGNVKVSRQGPEDLSGVSEERTSNIMLQGAIKRELGSGASGLGNRIYQAL